MGNLLLEQIKKQTTTFLREKYKSARMTFTDVTEAELLAEEATNKDECNPDAKKMTRIAEASFEIDEYCRIVDVLHRRLYSIDWDQWRQSYKALLLEFLLTHGPKVFAQEFQCDADIIEELGRFINIDERGFNWGPRMLKVSDQVLKLLKGGETLREARLKALKITNEIQGFETSVNSPSSSSPCSSTSEASAGSSSFCSFSTTSAPSDIDSNELNKHKSPTTEITRRYSQGGIGDDDDDDNIVFPSENQKHRVKNHLWDGPAVEERNVLIDSDEDENDEKPKGFISGIRSKLIGSGTVVGSRENIQFRCLSDVGRKGAKKKFDRQYSLWY